MANGSKVIVVNGPWAGLKCTVVGVNGSTVVVAPEGEDLVGTFNVADVQGV